MDMRIHTKFNITTIYQTHDYCRKTKTNPCDDIQHMETHEKNQRHLIALINM